MEANKKLLQDLTPEIESTSTRWYIVFSSFFLVFCIGIYALVQQIDKGHIVTGMRDNVVWGLYIVNFIFFMGLSYAGALLSGVLHLFHTGWRKPVVRLAELITVISLVIGPFFIFLLHRPSRQAAFPGYVSADPVTDHLGRYSNFNRPHRMLHVSLSFFY